MAKLLVQESDGAREFELVDLEVNIGRELDNTLRLSDPSISRHHAVLRQAGSGWEVQDLGSSNGVLLNGNRVQTAPLADGDRITLGQMQLTFVDPKPLAQDNPLGTVRMNLGEMALLQAAAAPPPEPPRPASAPEPVAFAMAPPIVPQAQPLAPESAATGWNPQPPAGNPEGAPAGPAPAFLRPFLPPVPDDAQPIQVGGAIERGDFLTRLIAGLIDYSPALLLGLFSTIWNILHPPFGGGGLGFSCGFGCLLGLLSLSLAVAYLVFLPWCWMGHGATPGKKIMKLRVVPEANPTGRLNLSASILRLLGYFVNGIIAAVLMFPINFILARMLGVEVGLAMAISVPFILATGVVGFFVRLAPFLLILGSDRKGLEDIFSRSIVIKVDR